MQNKLKHKIKEAGRVNDDHGITMNLVRIIKTTVAIRSIAMLVDRTSRTIQGLLDKDNKATKTEDINTTSTLPRCIKMNEECIINNNRNQTIEVILHKIIKTTIIQIINNIKMINHPTIGTIINKDIPTISINLMTLLIIHSTEITTMSSNNWEIIKNTTTIKLEITNTNNTNNTNNQILLAINQITMILMEKSSLTKVTRMVIRMEIMGIQEVEIRTVMVRMGGISKEIVGQAIIGTIVDIIGTIVDIIEEARVTTREVGKVVKEEDRMATRETTKGITEISTKAEIEMTDMITEEETIVRTIPGKTTEVIDSLPGDKLVKSKCYDYLPKKPM